MSQICHINDFLLTISFKFRYFWVDVKLFGRPLTNQLRNIRLKFFRVSRNDVTDIFRTFDIKIFHINFFENFMNGSTDWEKGIFNPVDANARIGTALDDIIKTEIRIFIVVAFFLDVALKFFETWNLQGVLTMDLRKVKIIIWYD